jgi:hypothetical protein
MHSHLLLQYSFVSRSVLVGFGILQRQQLYIRVIYPNPVREAFAIDEASPMRKAVDDIKKYFERVEIDSFGVSVTCSLICLRRQCRIKAELVVTCKVSKSIRVNRVLAFRDSVLVRNPKPSNVSSRFHDPSCELHCSFA